MSFAAGGAMAPEYASTRPCGLRQELGRHKHSSAGCLDSQSVKGTATPGARGYDAGKKINGRKRHILVDTLGLVLMVVVSAASVQDRDGARRLLRCLPGSCKKLRTIWVDGGYAGRLLQWVAAHFRFRLSCARRRPAASSCCPVASARITTA
jgi:putative transposase